MRTSLKLAILVLHSQVLLRRVVLILAWGVGVEVAHADFTFGVPQDLGLGSGGYISVSADELELYFTSDRAGGLGNEDLWVSTRQSVHDPWGPPTNLQTINSSYREGFPSISADALILYFSDYFHGPDRAGGQGGHDLWFSTRASRNAPWSAPVNMGAPFSRPGYDISPTLSHDGLIFIFASGGPVFSVSGNYNLLMCTRPSVQEAWGPPVNMGPRVNSGSHEHRGNLSPDGLVLFFESSNRGGSFGTWMTMRRTVNDPWELPVPLPEPMYSMELGCVSADGSMLYAGMSQVPILPVVDFTGDYKVDIEDLLILIEHWGENEPSFDMGPMPWGDGVVDAQDLEVLMSYWGRQLDDPHFIAHWKLDEIEGDVAYDSAAENDAVVMGDALWQPEGGQVQGALRLDGIDNYVATSLRLNPADAAFSIFAWVKGEAPGQVIISQEDGADWLLTDTQGYLMTALTSGGRRSGDPLVSETIITDDNWHRVGFTWDGTNRILYVDDVEVAYDTLSALRSSEGSLYIGTSRSFEAGIFWSGLIDDVRIYSRVVKP
jgi:hypothetical protein